METNEEKVYSPRRATLDYLESQIDIWNRTANYKKGVITVWRWRITWTMLIGAAFGLLSKEFSSEYWIKKINLLTDHPDVELHTIFAILSAVAIALSTYAGSRILSNDLEKGQLKARAAAEGLKVQGYLYAMKAPPYSGKNAEKVLFKRVEIIMKDVSSIAPDFTNYKEKKTKFGKFLQVLYTGKRDPNDENRWIQRFDADMTFKAYVDQRVKGQIDGYYRKKAAEFQKIINNANAAMLIFGFIGVVIGSIGATYSAGLTMWIGLLSTATASIASYVHANKYEYLLMSYVSTASQLELIAARYASMTTPSIYTQRRFVAETETIFATEHNSWISEIAGSLEDEIEASMGDEDVVENETATVSDDDSEPSEEITSEPNDPDDSGSDSTNENEDTDENI